MKTPHHALIRISVDLVAGNSRLQTIVAEIQDVGRIVAGSSVYKRFLNSRREDLNSELLLVVKLETQKSEIEMFDFLKKKEMISPRQGMAKPETYTLLAYDQTTRLVPGQNLPSTLLHQDFLTLRCASEAWGAYEHPVLGQTLNELVKSTQQQKERSTEHTEFFSQFLNSNK
jgi:hypothetical protein